MMQTSRRKFLINSAVLAAGTALLPNHLFSSPIKEIERIGLQLYTVRDAMHADPTGTLKQLATIGYKHLEHAGYSDSKFYGLSVKDFKKVLDDNFLNMTSGHVVLQQKHWDAAKNDFTDEWKRTLDDALDIHQKYLISPGLDDNLKHDFNAFKAFMDVFNKCGELCKSKGMVFGYHNHDFEFTTIFGNDRMYDLILANTDPALVTQQLDIGNMYSAGAIPMDYIKKYPGRFELMHVKDVIKKDDGKYENTLLGKGLLPLKEILKTARKKGTSQFIIEQEDYQGMDPIASTAIDLKVMQGLGY
jgi:sugar phosphate isomerase/epimerase